MYACKSINVAFPTHSFTHSPTHSHNSLFTMFQFLFVTLLCVLGATSTMASTPEGLAFLAANKDKEGVVTLPSGLQYKVLRSGPEGGLTPKVNSPCDCHYRGYLMDGVTEFDSSYKRGTTTKFAPNQVIKGWTEAMQLMKEVSELMHT
jgi:FKBP-type peptidyl-prolyl cis-trans isomerase